MRIYVRFWGLVGGSCYYFMDMIFVKKLLGELGLSFNFIINRYVVFVFWVLFFLFLERGE